MALPAIIYYYYIIHSQDIEAKNKTLSLPRKNYPRACVCTTTAPNDVNKQTKNIFLVICLVVSQRSGWRPILYMITFWSGYFMLYKRLIKKNNLRFFFEKKFFDFFVNSCKKLDLTKFSIRAKLFIKEFSIKTQLLVFVLGIIVFEKNAFESSNNGATKTRTQSY